MQQQERLERLYTLVRETQGRAERVVQELDRESNDLELRRLLRPHWEVPVREAMDIQYRQGLDDELYRLELLEVAAETAYLETDVVVTQVSAATRRLLGRDAVQRFVDAYLYFGTRFLACRVTRHELREQSKEKKSRADSGKEQRNVRSMALPAPPALGEPGKAAAPHPMDRFIEHQTLLDRQPNVAMALRFLDDFVPIQEASSAYAVFGEQKSYLLWLRGLLEPEDSRQQERFEGYTNGMLGWIQARADFYRSLDSAALSARFGWLSFYMLARIFRAQVSPLGTVSYAERSWIDDLSERRDVPLLREQEQILRRVFSLACDLIQESVHIAQSQSTPPKDGVETLPLAWRFVFDEETEEIKRQRAQRLIAKKAGESDELEKTPPAEPCEPNERNCYEGAKWSLRALRKAPPLELLGLAFSGGGIRSATFNLGVLEGLRSLDMLRKFDYLSTVSGGGYIGAWLAANVKRTPFWLTKGTSWAESIRHLRSHSNYLSPQVGVLSADTWTMVGIWLRNTSLIQLTVFATLLCILIAVRVAKLLFDWWPDNGWPEVSVGLLLISMAGVGLNLCRNEGPGQKLRWFHYGQTQVQALIVAPLWIMSLLVGAVMWKWAGEAPFAGLTEYSAVLKVAWVSWRYYLLISAGCLWVVATLTHSGDWVRRIFWGFWTAVASTAAMYLALCGIMKLFQGWTRGEARYDWAAFVWTPPLLLAVFAVTIVLFLGLLSRQSLEWTREWWTRLGAWLAAYAFGALLFSVIGVYGPMLVLSVAAMEKAKFGAAGAWIFTTAAGLMAGSGPQTKGEAGKPGLKGLLLDLVAKVASIVFIGVTVLLLSTALQSFYAAMLDMELSASGPVYWYILDKTEAKTTAALLGAMVLLTLLFAWRFDINVFSLNSFYKNRLVRCYLGATRWGRGLRKAQPFTGFDEQDDLPLKNLRTAAEGEPYRGPFPIVNCAVNLGGSSDLSLHTRHSASFTLTPLYCGSSRPGMGYVPTQTETFVYAGSGNPTLGQAIAVSGAAANPNMGYHTAPLVAFLMTLFNVRLGWWFPNPGRESREKPSPKLSLHYLLTELFGMAGEKSLFVNVSDGGHFENLGVYELVRRRCKVIIACDSESDEQLRFEGLGNLIRICEVDHGAKIRINVDCLRKNAETGLSRSHAAVGRIEYSNGSFGYLVYIKASLTGDEDPAVQQYQSAHGSFPHETTADQFFTEDQFESYRRLGEHIVERAFRDAADREELADVAQVLADLWTPAANPVATLIDHTSGLEEFWSRFQEQPHLHRLLTELFCDQLTPTPAIAVPAEEFAACVALLQRMENAYMELRLDDHWDHPDHRGWQMRFLCWAKSGTLRAVWRQVRETHGLRFRHFCQNKLGLPF